MPTVESPSDEEVERRSSALSSALMVATSAVAAVFAAELVTQATISTASVATLAPLWRSHVDGLVRLVVSTFLDASGAMRVALDRDGGHGLPEVDGRVVELFARDVRTRLGNFGERLQRHVLSTISAGPHDGEASESFAARVVGDATPSPAQVAQTALQETRAAWAAGSLEQARALGDRARFRRTWHATHDDRVRSWHLAANGQTVEGDEPFHVGDSWLAAPEVPAPGRTVDVGDLCNCRCGVTYDFDIITENNTSVGDTGRGGPVSELLPEEASLTAAGEGEGNWKPDLHPRGKDGKFIKKGSLATLLGTNATKLTDIINMTQTIDHKQWDNLTDAQKEHLHKLVDKLPTQSGIYKSAKSKFAELTGTPEVAPTHVETPTPHVPTPSAPEVAHEAPHVATPAAPVIPAHKGAKPGSPAKVSTALIWGKYDDGTVILESADGKQRLRWDGGTKKYEHQIIGAESKWQMTASYGKKDAYAKFKDDASWVVPGGEHVAPTPTPTPTPEHVPAPTPAPVATTTLFDISDLATPTGKIKWSALNKALKGKKLAPGTVVVEHSYGNADYQVAVSDSGTGFVYKMHHTWDPAGKWTSFDESPTALGAASESYIFPVTDWKISSDIVHPIHGDETPTHLPAETLPATPPTDASKISKPDGTLNHSEVKDAVTIGMIAPGTVIGQTTDGQYNVIVTDEGQYQIGKHVGSSWFAGQTTVNLVAPYGEWQVPHDFAFAKPDHSPMPENFTTSSAVLPSQLASWVLDNALVSSDPIAWHQSAQVSQRIIKVGDGQFRIESRNSKGYWGSEGIFTSDTVKNYLSQTNAWKMNPAVLPNVDKPTGMPIADWGTHLKQDFPNGDVVATHSSGMLRVKAAYDSGYGTVYDVQAYNPSTNTWGGTGTPSTTDLFAYYFADGQVNKDFPGGWVATEPHATPTPESGTFAATPGGMPLKHDESNVITDWSVVLDGKTWSKGDIVGVSSDGMARMVAGGGPGASGTFSIEKWDSSLNKWQHSDDIYYPGDWLAPLPGNKPYPVETPPGIATAKPGKPAIKDLTTPDGYVNWDAVDQAVKDHKLAPSTLIADYFDKNSSFQLVVDDTGTGFVFKQSYNINPGKWHNAPSSPSSSTASKTNWAVTAAKWKMPKDITYVAGADAAPTPGAPITGNDAKKLWDKSESQADGTIIAEGTSKTGHNVHLIVTSDGLSFEGQTLDGTWSPVYSIHHLDDLKMAITGANIDWHHPTGSPSMSATPSPVVPGPVHVVEPTTGPGVASTPAITGDISGIPDHVMAGMKGILKPDKIGYWSKPEKIWDGIQKIQNQHPDITNPGHSQYSPLQVINALDFSTKTSTPSPFATKMTKWAATPAGQAYIKKSLAGTPVPSLTPTLAPTPTPTPMPTSTPTGKFPGVASSLDYSSAWSKGKPATGKQIVDLLSTGQHLDVVAVHVKGNIQHRVVRSSNDPDTGEMRFYVQRRDHSTAGGWDVVVPHGSADGLMKTSGELDSNFPGMKFRSTEGTYVAPTPVAHALPKPTVQVVPVHVGGDDISHLYGAQKTAIYAKFKASSGTYLSSPEHSIFTALNAVALTNNLSLMQALKVIDEEGAKKAGTPNAKMFETKISKWLGTKAGTLAAAGIKETSAMKAKQLDYSPGMSAGGIPSFEESSKLTYGVMKVSDAHKFDKEALHSDTITASQTAAQKTYTGGVYSEINSYLYGDSSSASTSHINTAKNVQKSMRPSDRPILLHRGVNFDGIGESTGYDDLASKVGQTWLSGGFFSTSVGGSPAFSHKPVLVEIEAPPGTPMAWLERKYTTPAGGTKTVSKYPGEHEMLLAAGLSYRIISVKKEGFKTVVRVRVVPPTEEVTV